MKTNQSRREFLAQSTKIGLLGGALAYCPRILSFGNMLQDDTIPDPKKLNYCGYTCPPDCPMKKATLENDVELKKEAYKNWRIEEKYGIAFDPEKIFCYGCKTTDKPLGIVVEKCTVRNCAIAKGYDCCIECADLSACDKEIWKTFPDFHKAVIEMQKKYLEAKV
jgi:hypothetical protein